jgi:hypothetical protein
MFQVPYIRYAFDHYFAAEHPALDGPWTNDGKSEESAAQRMASSVGNYTTLWLVASESWLWDERDLTHQWLESHASLLDWGSFTRVDVYHYQVDQPGAVRQSP